MASKILPEKKTYLSSLSEDEKKEIEENVNYQLHLTNFNTLKEMTLVGAFTNALTGFFVIWVLYKQVSHSILFSWYALLILFNVINVVWSEFFAYGYPHLTIGLLKKWHKGLYFILAGLCLTWGSIGVLFVSQNPFYQLFVITFLQIAVLSFTFGSIFDFLLSLICIVCLLMPTITWQLYEAIMHVATLGHDKFLNLAFSLSLFILGSFLLIAAFLGYKLTNSQATLSFFNKALNEKLDNLNKFLEERVKERTIELEKSLELVTYQATHDLLTDLPNQRLLLDYLQKAIDSCNQNKHIFCVISFCINKLESINNGLGHEVGDLVIKTIAERFKKYLPNNTINLWHPIEYIVTLSRKDTFIIILNNIFKLEEIDPAAENLFTILNEPIVTEKQIIKVTGSIGMALYPRDGSNIHSLLMNSDAAMTRAKQRGGNSIGMYESELNADASRQLELDSYLHEAVKNNEFILHYQPFVELKTGKICGMEALIRWNHPSLGFISPIHFIPLAEKNGVIVPLSEWVMRTACVQLKRWKIQGFNDLKMAINLSAKQLLDKNIIQTIIQIIKETDITPEDIELELTESEAFQDEVIPMLKQLKSLGFRLSIDDFGTGFSGLSNIKLFPIDKLKIDKSFISDLTTNIHSKTIASNIIDLAKNLQITILAEGVETKEQLNFLIEKKCDLIQGFYFSPPVDANEFTALLNQQIPFNI